MGILESIGVLSLLIYGMLDEAKKRFIPDKWTHEKSELWALALAIVFCVFLPYFSFLAPFVGAEVFTLALGQRIAMAVFIMLGSGIIHKGIDKLKK